MGTGDGFFMIGRDPAVERVSVLVTPSRVSPGIKAELALKAARIGADITVIRGALLTLVIVQSVMPVLPFHQKAVAGATGMVAAFSLVAASTDIVVQLGQLDIPFGLMTSVPDKDLEDTAKRLEDLMDPVGTAMKKVIDHMGKLGLLDPGMAKLSMEFKAFVDARQAAMNSGKASEKILHALASLEAARKFFEKLSEEAKKKSEQALPKDNSGQQRDNWRSLEREKPVYPGGVDYPNQPNDGRSPGGSNGRNQVA